MDGEPISVARGEHQFDASGTRHRCGVLLSNGYLCARPEYHADHDVKHGALTGEKLW